MKTPKLGRLEKVELRTAWSREDTDFTPWLAGEENIALLGQTIGIELEVQQEEAPVGPYRADILARDTLTSHLVVIENQLEKTDHIHLGQTLTYAAGLDAVTMVWIASRFTEEHRAALDWLNRITHEDFRFFGLEIELWKIGESEPAPKFNLVAKPNDWSKSVRETSKGPSQKLTPGQEKQISFWAEFGAVIEAGGRRWTVPKPQPASWIGYGIGRTGAGMFPTVSVKSGWVAVRLSMEEYFFRLLERDKADIESELGQSAHWKPKPGRKESTIELRREGDLDDPQQRRALMTWMLDTMDAFERVFRPRIKVLNPADWNPEQDEAK